MGDRERLFKKNSSMVKKKWSKASHWPWFEIPKAVKENKDNFPISNELNSQLALIPIHQSILTNKYLIF